MLGFVPLASLMQQTCVKEAKNFSLGFASGYLATSSGYTKMTLQPGIRYAPYLSSADSSLLVNSSECKKNFPSAPPRVILRLRRSLVSSLSVRSMLLSPLHSMLLSLCFFFFSKTSALKASFGY